MAAISNHVPTDARAEVTTDLMTIYAFLRGDIDIRKLLAQLGDTYDHRALDGHDGPVWLQENHENQLGLAILRVVTEVLGHSYDEETVDNPAAYEKAGRIATANCKAAIDAAISRVSVEIAQRTLVGR